MSSLLPYFLLYLAAQVIVTAFKVSVTAGVIWLFRRQIRRWLR